MKLTKPAKVPNPKHEAAIRYAREGFPILPIMPNAKQPLTSHGHKDATTDLRQIRKWWTRWPDANIGIKTDDLLVLDVDVKSGVDGFASLEELQTENADLPETRTQETPSGGRHFIFRADGVTVPSMVHCPKPGIDVRSANGYILAAPSTVNGTKYSMGSTEIANAPEWLLDHLLSLEAGAGDGYHEDIYHNENGHLTWLCVEMKPTHSVKLRCMGQELQVRHDPKSMSFVID